MSGRREQDLHETDDVRTFARHAGNGDGRPERLEVLAEEDIVNRWPHHARVDAEPTPQRLFARARHAHVAGKPEVAPGLAGREALEHVEMVLAEEHLAAVEIAALLYGGWVILRDHEDIGGRDPEIRTGIDNRDVGPGEWIPETRRSVHDEGVQSV